MVPPQHPVFSSFPSPQQTNWPTDSWAGVQVHTETTSKPETVSQASTSATESHVSTSVNKTETSDNNSSIEDSGNTETEEQGASLSGDISTSTIHTCVTDSTSPQEKVSNGINESTESHANGDAPLKTDDEKPDERVGGAGDGCVAASSDDRQVPDCSDKGKRPCEAVSCGGDIKMLLWYCQSVYVGSFVSHTFIL